MQYYSLVGRQFLEILNYPSYLANQVDQLGLSPLGILFLLSYLVVPKFQLVLVLPVLHLFLQAQDFQVFPEAPANHLLVFGFILNL